jgi:hypothetical protein
VLVSIATETEGSPHIDRESLKLLVRPVTASNGWHADELSTIGGSGEVDIATQRNVMCHYAILDASGDGEATTWLEPVTDEQYLAAHRTAGV